MTTGATHIGASWGELADVLNPAVLSGARLVEVASDGTPLRPPMLDTEPWRGGSFYDLAPFGIKIPPNPDVVAAAARLRATDRAVEIGCGAGRNVVALLAGTANVVVLDQSRSSLERVVREQSVRAVRGSALSLPFVDQAFDFTICDGVAHHTGDTMRGLAEAVRVTRPDGTLYLSVYRAGNLYEFLYRTLGGYLRLMARTPAVGAVVDSIAFALYQVASGLIKRGRSTDRDVLRSLYEDYFLTPIATFHRSDEIRHLLGLLGCKVERLEVLGNVWSIIARRERLG